MSDAASIASTVKTGLEAAALAVHDVDVVITSLNTARSVVITVGNNTSHNLELLSTSHDHGGFSVAPPGVVARQTTAAFGSQSSSGSVATGTEGSATYRVDGGITFTVHWDNPFAGGNSSSESIDGPNHNRFRGVSTAGSGDEKAPMRYDIFEIEMHNQNVYGAILDKWAETDWAAGPLGFPTGGEAGTPDGVGRYSNFQGGVIFFRPETGPHGIHGAIFARWTQIGRETFGYPTTDEGTTRDGVGRYQHYTAFLPHGTADCSIFWKPTLGAHEVYGAIHAKWASMGYETGSLGYPVDAEGPMPGGRIQNFEHGAIVFTAGGGAVVK